MTSCPPVSFADISAANDDGNGDGNKPADDPQIVQGVA
jgi:hypothetical protein